MSSCSLQESKISNSFKNQARTVKDIAVFVQMQPNSTRQDLQMADDKGGATGSIWVDISPPVSSGRYLLPNKNDTRNIRYTILQKILPLVLLTFSWLAPPWDECNRGSVCSIGNKKNTFASTVLCKCVVYVLFTKVVRE